MKNTQKLLYHLKYFFSCLTIWPIIKYRAWVKQIKNTNILIQKILENIVLLCQSYRTKITKIFTFFGQKNKSKYADTILKKFLIFEINNSTFKDFLKLNESFGIVVTKFLKIGKKTLDAYWNEVNIFKKQINFYTKAINSFLGEVKFNFRSWPKKYLKKIYLQINNI